MPAKNDPLKPLKAEAKQLDPIDRVRYWAAREKEAHDELERAVGAARSEGASWQQVADAAGIEKRQTARVRFDKELAELNRERAQAQAKVLRGTAPKAPPRAR